MNTSPTADSPDEGESSRRPFWKQERFLRLTAFALLAIIAAVVMVWLRSWALHNATLSADENSYEFQANLFARGHLKHPFPGCSLAFFHEMIVLDAQKGWFSRYQPGHSLWLTPGVWLGRPHIMVVLSGILTLLLARAAASWMKAPPLATTLMFVLSPFFLFTHATLLSHSTGLLAVALLIYAYVRWKQTSGPRAAALAGAAWGWLLLTRPFTAACLAPVLAIDVTAWFLLDRPSRRAIGTGVAGAVATAGIGVACLLTYNTLMVGSPLTMTHTFYDPGDSIGFGGLHGHTFRRGLENLHTNLLLYDRWLWGWKGTLLVAAGLAAYGWERRWTPWLLGCAAAATTGHILFWHPGIHDTGPIYWFESIPFVFAAAALGVGRILKMASGMRFHLQATVAVVLALSAAALRFDWHEASVLRSVTADFAALRDAVASAPPNAVVMANSSKSRYTGLYRGQLVFNPLGLASQPIIVRVDSEADETFLRRLFAGRPLFFLNLRWNGLVALPESHNPMNWTPALNSVPCDTGVTLLSEGHDASRQGRAKRDALGWLVRGLRRSLTPGDYVLDVEVETGVANEDAATMSVRDTAAGREQEIARVTIPSCGGTSASSMPFRLEHVAEVEVRIWFAGTSDVTVKRITIRDQPDASRSATKVTRNTSR